jgi:hypothetical protein
MPDPTKVIDLKTAPRAKVLVAEDEQDIASLIEDWLSEIYDVTVALEWKDRGSKGRLAPTAGDSLGCGHARHGGVRCGSSFAGDSPDERAFL